MNAHLRCGPGGRATTEVRTMPGHRLDHQDRERIAAGLTEGLGYAEIARRLGRPTSTVTREVSRNGGRDGYRAGAAHRAAGQRARRRPGPRPAPPEAGDAYGRDLAAVHDFEDRYVAMMVETGLPPTIARVLGALLLADDGGRTATELVRHLHVSPASVSKAVRYLEQIGLVTRERDQRSRRERYLVGDDVHYRAWEHAFQSHRRWAAAAEEGAKVMGAETPAGARLAEMGLFFGMMARDLRRSAEHWWRVLDEQRRRSGDPDPA
ncbi:MarR family transcriptional regulator [Plantactinospora sp. GCM10030261]|uniref:GbsR/MarR family transcriptional regulator n=1 Tax=Plantactinospora sp. GCM10030261 TaxID=3273420 RepID=UPI0036206198